MQKNNRTIINPVVKDEVSFIEMVSDNDESKTILSILLSPDGGNDLHYHDNFDETFIAVEGDLGVTLDQQDIILRQGEQVTVPKGRLHRFYNPNDHPVRFEVQMNPGNRNMEEFLQIIYGLARDGKVLKNALPYHPLHIGVLAQLGETLPPKDSMLSRVGFIFRWLGKYAERRGVVAQLREKYVKY